MATQYIFHIQCAYNRSGLKDWICYDLYQPLVLSINGFAALQ